MEKNILVAFDDSENAMRAVEYIAQTFSANHHVTLYSVIPDTGTLCAMNSPELTAYFVSEQAAFCALEDQKRKLLEAALAKAKELLVATGFPEGNIKIKLETKKKGVARDIIDEASEGYDLIVIGRRGISGIKEFFMGSVSQKVLNAAGDKSVLIVN